MYFVYYGLTPLLLLPLLFISMPLRSYGLDNLYAMLNIGVFSYRFITLTTMSFRVGLIFGLISTSLVVYVLTLVIEHSQEKFILYMRRMF